MVNDISMLPPHQFAASRRPRSLACRGGSTRENLPGLVAPWGVNLAAMPLIAALLLSDEMAEKRLNGFKKVQAAKLNQDDAGRADNPKIRLAHFSELRLLNARFAT